MPLNTETRSLVIARASKERPPRRGSRAERCVAVLALAVSIFGCSQYSNPFTDELADRPAVSTASVDGARAADVEPVVTTPRGEVKAVPAADGTVTHGSLFFEDPNEETGSDDGLFAWTREDYWQIWTWRGRFLFNTLLYPISAVSTPPWQKMSSDGHLSREVVGYQHDAQVETSN